MLIAVRCSGSGQSRRRADCGLLHPAHQRWSALSYTPWPHGCAMGKEETATQAAARSCSGQPSPLSCMVLYAHWYRRWRCKASSVCVQSAVGLMPSSLLHLQAEVVAPTEREAAESRGYQHQQTPVIAQRSSSSSDVWCTERLASHAIAAFSTAFDESKSSRDMDGQQACRSAISSRAHPQRLKVVVPLCQQNLGNALYQYAALAQQQPSPIVRGRK